MKCRFCSNPVDQVFVDLGSSPPSNSYLLLSQLNESEAYFPLKIFVCDHCFLVQVDEYAKHNDIFNNSYAYFSSYSSSWLSHAKLYTEKMVAEFGIDTGSLVVEIASNDGYLLQYFKEKNIPVLGIEPTANTAAAAKEKGIESVVDFFGASLAKSLIEKNVKADLLIGNNVLAHVPDINDFVEGMSVLLSPDGIITMEFPHLLNLVAQNQFDTIYHEHFSYLSFSVACRIFEAHGLTIFHVEELSTHGGSLRIFAKHAGSSKNPIRKSVTDLLKKEETLGMNDLAYYQFFNRKVEEVKNNFLDFLIKAKNENKKVAAYGAAAKGNTLLNYCGVKKDLIEYIVDASPHKQGKYAPGSHIPIVDESFVKLNKPDYIVILPWNLKDEIMDQLSYISEWNAKFVIAIPQLSIL